MLRLPASPTLQVLFRSVDTRRARLGAALGLALASAATGILTPLLIARLITALGAHHRMTEIVLELIATVLVGAFAGGWSSYLLSSVGERAVADVRITLVRHIIRLPLGTVRRFGVGELISRVGADAAQLRSITDTAVTALPVSAVMVLAYLSVMVWLDWLMCLVVIGTFAVASIAIRAFLLGMRRGAQGQQAALGRLAQTAQSVFGLVATVKAYRAEERAIAPLEKETAAAATAAIRTARSQAAISPLMGLGQQIAIVGVLAVGGGQLSSGKVSVAHFIAFLMYLFQLLNPLMTLAQGAGRIRIGTAAAARMDAVLASELEPQAGDALVPAVSPAGHLTRPAVGLSDVVVHIAGKPVLNGVSLQVPRIGMLAIVGPSGAGKTTVLNVIERFVDPAAGRVELFGTELSRWPLTQARQRMVLVEQGSAILNASIRQNLCLGRDDRPTDEVLFAALRDVGLEEIVRAQAAGLDAVLGEAIQLSGGEQQRLAITRALLTDADILMLDEPTSHLDTANEARLVRLLEEVGHKRAVIVVAHRISTIRNAGSIAVMDSGRVIACGDHASLLANCPSYQALVRTQDDAVSATRLGAAETGQMALVEQGA